MTIGDDGIASRDNTGASWTTTQNTTGGNEQPSLQDLAIQAASFLERLSGLMANETAIHEASQIAFALRSRAAVAAVEGDADLYQTAKRVLRWLYATMNPKCGDKSLMSVTQFEIHAELERAVLDAHAAQVQSRIAAAASAPAPAEPAQSPRCPKCGYVMCQQFDSRPVNALADIATPNGKYICYHCTPATPAQPEGEQETK